MTSRPDDPSLPSVDDEDHLAGVEIDPDPTPRVIDEPATTTKRRSDEDHESNDTRPRLLTIDPTAGLGNVAVHGRLNVELRAIGLIATVWLLSWAFAGVWLRQLVEPTAGLPVYGIVLSASIALALVLGFVIARLPAQRWLRVSATTLPNPSWLLLTGAPAVVGVPYLLWRDARARRLVPSAREANACFLRLLRLPREAAWAHALIFVASLVPVAIDVVTQSHLPGFALASAGVAAVAFTVTQAVIVAERLRAMLRPEVLSVALRRDAPPEATRRLASRLCRPSVAVAISMIALPLVCAEVWAARHRHDQAIAIAESTASRLAELADAGASQALGRELAHSPASSVAMNRRTYGARRTIPNHRGPLDLDDDGRVDVWVVQVSGAAAMTPIVYPTAEPPWLVMVSVLLGAGLLAATSLLVAHDVAHDVTRTTNQVAAVARGAIPPPLREESFSTHELRQLVTSVDRLVERITDANMEKFISIEKANEADRLKSQFLANMSHDLRSPLNSILGFSELMLAGIDGELTDEQREVVHMMHQSGRSLLQQIDDILDAAKLDARRMELAPEPLPPVAMLGRAIQSARARQGRAMPLQTRAEAGLPPAFVDPYRTTQAVENVLVFASETLTDEPIEIDLYVDREAPERTIVLRVVTPRRSVPTSDLDQVLRGFHRLPGHEGLRLGLPIAAQILELQGGRLEVSEEGPRTVLSLHLPVARRVLRTMRLKETPK